MTRRPSIRDRARSYLAAAIDAGADDIAAKASARRRLVAEGVPVLDAERAVQRAFMQHFFVDEFGG